MYQSAEISIGFLIAIIWVVLSWFISTKNKKRKLQAQSGEGQQPPRKQSGLAGLFEELSKNLEPELRKIIPPEEIKPEEPVAVQTPINDVQSEWEVSQSGVEIPGKSIQDELKNFKKWKRELTDLDENYAVRTKSKRIEISNGVLKRMGNIADLKQTMVLKEILGKPRALAPYDF